MTPSSWTVRLVAAAATVVLLLGMTTAAYRLGVQSSPAVQSAEDAQVLVELYDRLLREAVEAPDGEELIEGAIRGMLDTLGDPYAAYYDPEAFVSFNEMLDGSFSGVGLLLEDAPEGLTVLRVLEGTPAEAAGVEAGERIVSVDGRDTREVPVDVVVDLVQGPEGTSVRLGLEGGSQGSREVEVTRARIELPNIEARLEDDGTGYVRLMQFTVGSSEKVRAAIEGLLEQGASGIVFDLRGNPGGLLREAVAVSSLFIEEGTVVTVKERDRDDQVFGATGEAFADLPLVVLVDGGTASASEIVAGALQDYQRAHLVGETTFGKGTVQAVRRLSDESGVKFTIARYYTPSGDTITGLVPDRQVDEPEDQLAVARELLRALVARPAAFAGSAR